MTMVPSGFFITAQERGEVERVHEMMIERGVIYRPNYSQIMEITEKAKLLRDGEAADAVCAEQDGDEYLARSARQRAIEINEVIKTWRRRWRESATQQ